MMPTGTDIDRFAAWVEELMRTRGYDIDSPRGGGKSKLAEDAGVHRAAVTRLLQRQSMPDLDTMRGLARALDIPIREILIRSGKLTEEDLPQVVGYPAVGVISGTSDSGYVVARMTLEQVAEALGIPDDRREMFIKVAQQFTPETTGTEQGTDRDSVAGGTTTRRLAAG